MSTLDLYRLDAILCFNCTVRLAWFLQSHVTGARCSREDIDGRVEQSDNIKPTTVTVVVHYISTTHTLWCCSMHLAGLVLILRDGFALGVLCVRYAMSPEALGSQSCNASECCQTSAAEAAVADCDMSA